MVDDNVTVFFGISFEDPVDKAIAKLILTVIRAVCNGRKQSLGNGRSKKANKELAIGHQNA